MSRLSINHAHHSRSPSPSLPTRRHVRKSKSNRNTVDRLIDALMPVFAMLLAFAIGGLILALQGVNPWKPTKRC
ncbi:MAG: hypothetical protein M5U34_38480 [Chloroflexi bacterium]|nr:hypothetical protein [Chloroflexota bacterium]